MVAKKASFEFDAAGWLFWTVLLAVFLGPCLWGVWQITYEDTSALVRIGMGGVSAAVGAGFVSWVVNAVLQHYRKKKRLAQRKKAKRRG